MFIIIIFFLDVSKDSNNICMKTGWFSAMLTLGAGAMCLLGGALLAVCMKMRKAVTDKTVNINRFGGYMAHKGRIN